MDLLEVPVPEGLPGRRDARRRLPRRVVGEVRRVHRPRRQGRLRSRGRRGQLHRRVRLRALVRAHRPRPRLARDRHRGRQAGRLRVRPSLRPRPGDHLGHDADAVPQRRQQEPHAAGELGLRWQHRRHDLAGRGPARCRRRLRPRPVRRRREVLLGPERRAGSRLQAGRAQRLPQPVRHDRQHLDAAAHAARRRDRPRRRRRALPGRPLVRRADLQRLVLQHQGRVAEVDQSLRPGRCPAPTRARWRWRRTTTTTRSRWRPGGTACPATRRSRCRPRPARARRKSRSCRTRSTRRSRPSRCRCRTCTATST